MPSTASFNDPKAYHILTYGTLLGSNLFQTFLAGPLAFKALPRPQFSSLQQAIFPPYFTFQTALPVLLALTWPGKRVAAVGGSEVTQNAGFWGIFSENSLLTAGVPVAIMFATSAANLLVFGPATTKVMKERKHQGKSAMGYSLDSTMLRMDTDVLVQRPEMARSTTTLDPRALRCRGSTPASASSTAFRPLSTCSAPSP